MFGTAESAAALAATIHQATARATTIDPDYGAYTGHPADPRAPEPEGASMDCDLGGLTVQVQYEATCNCEAILTAVIVAGHEVHPDEFARSTLDGWRNRIERQLERDLDDMRAAA